MLTIQPNDGYEKYLFDRAFETATPISGTFELLPICNMDCRMCYIRMSPEEMHRQGKMLNAEEWLSIGRQAAEKGALFILLTGGEPLLHPEFKEIYKGLRALGICVTINTNGTLITEEIADMWQQDLPRRVNISLYGSSDDIYGHYCRNSKGFTQVMHGIKLLKERNISVKLNCTLTPWNRDDMDNILLVDTTTIRSIPKNTVGDIASRDIISLTVDTSLRQAATIIAEKSIKGAPVMKKGKAVGMLSVTDIVLAVAEGKENLSVGDVMSDNVYIVDEDMKIANAVDIMFKKGLGRLVVADKDNDILGIVTRTDLIESLANLKQFPIFAGKK